MFQKSVTLCVSLFALLLCASAFAGVPPTKTLPQAPVLSFDISGCEGSGTSDFACSALASGGSGSYNTPCLPLRRGNRPWLALRLDERKPSRVRLPSVIPLGAARDFDSTITTPHRNHLLAGTPPSRPRRTQGPATSCFPSHSVRCNRRPEIIDRRSGRAIRHTLAPGLSIPEHWPRRAKAHHRQRSHWKMNAAADSPRRSPPRLERRPATRPTVS